MRQKGGGVRDEKKDENKDIKDDGTSKVSNNDMFKEAIDRL
jgi:hypothetical protein